MEINDYHVILDLFILFYGVTGLSSCIKTSRTRTLSSGRLIVPNGMSSEDCADPQAYLRYILPKATVFSLLNLLCGGIDLLCAFFPLPSVVVTVVISAFLVNLLVFGILLARGVKCFWRK